MTGGIPTYHELCAALLAAKLMDPDGATRSAMLESSIRSPSDGMYQAIELEHGCELLERVGLFRAEGDYLLPSEDLLIIRAVPDEPALELLLHCCLRRNVPVWLAGTSRDTTHFENVPEADAQSIHRVIADPDRREAFLLALAQQHDADQLRAIGGAAEDAVVQRLIEELIQESRPDLASEVRRVSLISDRLGYDITTPTLDQQVCRIEVKGTTLPCVTWIEVNLSRNEFRVGLNDPAWRLVACRVPPDGDAEVLGWCSVAALTPHVPHDPTEHGRWTSTAIRLRVDALEPGLPLRDY